MRNAALLILAAACLSVTAAQKWGMKGQGQNQFVMLANAAKAAVTCPKSPSMITEAMETLQENGVVAFLVDPGKGIKCYIQCILHTSGMMNKEGDVAKKEAEPLMNMAVTMGSFVLGGKNCQIWKANMTSCLETKYESYDDECSESWDLSVCCARTSLMAFQKVIKAMGGDKFLIPMIQSIVQKYALGMQ